jgi:hypothetical protein
MHSLPQHGAQDQHFRGWIIETPPWGQRGFAVARVTRITRDAAQFQVALRHPGREDQIVRDLAQLSLQRAQFAQGGIARRDRQSLEDLVVRSGDKRLGDRQPTGGDAEHDPGQHAQRHPAVIGGMGYGRRHSFQCVRDSSRCAQRRGALPFMLISVAPPIRANANLSSIARNGSAALDHSRTCDCANVWFQSRGQDPCPARCAHHPIPHLRERGCNLTTVEHHLPHRGSRGTKRASAWWVRVSCIAKAFSREGGPSPEGSVDGQIVAGAASSIATCSASPPRQLSGLRCPARWIAIPRVSARN